MVNIRFIKKINNLGERVGAIWNTDDKNKTLEFLGYGVYEGDFVPEEVMGIFLETIKEYSIPIPRIKLDNGKFVYGCECHYDTKKRIKEELEKAKRAGYEIIDVDIEQIRQDWRKK